jgi:hypothetical protein
MVDLGPGQAATTFINRKVLSLTITADFQRSEETTQAPVTTSKTA